MPTRCHWVAVSLFIVILTSVTFAGKRKHVIPDDLRNIVTSVNQSAHTITITSMRDKIDTVLTMADPTFYPNEVVINGEEKKFADIVSGLQYMTSVEVAHNVIQSISFRTADPAPK